MTRILLVSGFQQHMLDEIKNGHESWITHAIVVNCGVGAIYSPTPSALHYGETYKIVQKKQLTTNMQGRHWRSKRAQ